MAEDIDRAPHDSARFILDLRDAATAVGARFDESKVRRSIETFDSEIGSSVVQLKTTSRAGDGLYYRFFHSSEQDPLDTARRHGLLRSCDSPIGMLQREILLRLPGAARAGLDFDTGYGLAKCWTFTGLRPISDLFMLETIPEAVPAHAEFFERHAMPRAFFVASDFQHQTMNVYTVVEPGTATADWLRRLVGETGGATEDVPDQARMLAALSAAACLGMTFSWNSPGMHRWSLYGLNVPYLDPQAGRSLPALPERLRIFLKQSPTLSTDPQVNVAWSFGAAAPYTKLEKSYARALPAARARGSILYLPS
ncbi:MULTISPECIES: aromatic prenyltransferase [Pseudofrankia]|uniref:aromatic prenyltransferase n=1 Tax=Pseudofrankia TaxID=2994363 RepID=UPI000234C5AF|nr:MULTISPECIES: aromatic prenyltransferase [Pseudofrankia]OHV37116.1 hypothetical protein BCD49_18230 [Pseudofrankia sp. EUN1h]